MDLDFYVSYSALCLHLSADRFVSGNVLQCGAVDDGEQGEALQ